MTKKSIRSRAPHASSKQVRAVMRANVGRETKPEIALRSSLHRLGLRFRKDIRPEPELSITADIVFTRQRVCIFVDGCFWHGCPEHFAIPKSNSDWWKEKIEDNKNRDIRQKAELESRGWVVIRIWEHDISPEKLPSICRIIEQEVIREREGNQL